MLNLSKFRVIARWVFITGLLLSTTNLYAQTGLVGWWKLDEGTGTSATDASGNGNTGTLVSSPTWATGRVGAGALTFNGSSSVVTVAPASTLNDLNLTGMSFSAWIKPTGSGGGGSGRIVDKGGWTLRMSSTSTLEFLGDQWTGSAPTRNSSASAITLNTWQQVVVTWDGSINGTGMHIYINGVAADGTTSNGSGTLTSDAPIQLAIGNALDFAHGFAGSIDEVRVYNRVLSSTEIQTLADATAPGTPTGLSAAAASGTQINLSWTAPTDNVGVTGYLLERCQGASCSTFVQIGTPTTTTYSDTGLTASTAYSYRVRATDANSNLSAYSSIASATTTSGGGDTIPPSTPTGLTATAVSSSQINLSWSAATDNVGVTGYEIWRCQGASCSTFSLISTVTGTTYSDTGLTAATSYSYKLRAKDAAGNVGTYSSVSSASTGSGSGDTQAPTAPANLVIVATSSSEVDLSWQASTDNVGVVNYVLERCSGSGCSNFSPFGPVTAPPYYDTTVTAAGTYSYRVRAFDAAGNASPYSNVVSTTAPASSPDCN